MEMPKEFSLKSLLRKEEQKSSITLLPTKSKNLEVLEAKTEKISSDEKKDVIPLHLDEAMNINEEQQVDQFLGETQSLQEKTKQIPTLKKAFDNSPPLEADIKYLLSDGKSPSNPKPILSDQQPKAISMDRAETVVAVQQIKMDKASQTQQVGAKTIAKKKQEDTFDEEPILKVNLSAKNQSVQAVEHNFDKDATVKAKAQILYSTKKPVVNTQQAEAVVNDEKIEIYDEPTPQFDIEKILNEVQKEAKIEIPATVHENVSRSRVVMPIFPTLAIEKNLIDQNDAFYAGVTAQVVENQEIMSTASDFSFGKEFISQLEAKLSYQGTAKNSKVNPTLNKVQKKSAFVEKFISELKANISCEDENPRPENVLEIRSSDEAENPEAIITQRGFPLDDPPADRGIPHSSQLEFPSFDAVEATSICKDTQLEPAFGEEFSSKHFSGLDTGLEIRSFNKDNMRAMAIFKKINSLFHKIILSKTAPINIIGIQSSNEVENPAIRRFEEILSYSKFCAKLILAKYSRGESPKLKTQLEIRSSMVIDYPEIMAVFENISRYLTNGNNCISEVEVNLSYLHKNATPKAMLEYRSFEKEEESQGNIVKKIRIDPEFLLKIRREIQCVDIHHLKIPVEAKVIVIDPEVDDNTDDECIPAPLKATEKEFVKDNATDMPTNETSEVEDDLEKTMEQKENLPFIRRSWNKCTHLLGLFSLGLCCVRSVND